MLLCAEISRRGEKYLDKQIENAVNGVKEMKNVMEKSSDDRNAFLEALEKTKIQKEVTSSHPTMNLRFMTREFRGHVRTLWVSVPVHIYGGLPVDVCCVLIPGCNAQGSGNGGQAGRGGEGVQ